MSRCCTPRGPGLLLIPFRTLMRDIRRDALQEHRDGLDFAKLAQADIESGCYMRHIRPLGRWSMAACGTYDRARPDARAEAGALLVSVTQNGE